MSRAAASPSAPGSDVLWQMESELTLARRVQGAMRAVQCLVQPEQLSERAELQGLGSEDLAQLLDVLQSDLGARLDVLDDCMNTLMGYGRNAAAALAKAAGKQ